MAAPAPALAGARRQILLVLEAMKMEMPIVAPAAGVVKEIRVSFGQTCETDMVLAVIE